MSNEFHLDLELDQFAALHCRVNSNRLRLPRGHPEVQKPLSILLRCVERMPASGKLFTSQSPLSPIFIAGLVASHNRERRVVEEWFRTVTSTRSRSVSLLISKCYPVSLNIIEECTSTVACFANDLGLDGYYQSTCTRSKRRWYDNRSPFPMVGVACTASLE